VLFNHDLSNAHADAALKGILESTVVDNYVDLMASNLGGIPVLARVCNPSLVPDFTGPSVRNWFE
jgi:hypothetical protein